MTPGHNPPTIRTARAADVAPTPLGDAGAQRILLGAPRSDGSPLLMGVSYVHPGMTSPLIQHDTAELSYALTGTGWIVTDSSEHEFAPGDAVLIEAGCWHAIRAGNTPIEMLFVFPTPAAPTTRPYPSSSQ